MKLMCESKGNHVQSLHSIIISSPTYPGRDKTINNYEEDNEDERNAMDTR